MEYLQHQYRGLVVGIAIMGLVRMAGASTPDFNGGTWEAVNPPQQLLTTDGKPPPLLADARALYDKNRAARTAGQLTFDDTEKCLPPGFPRVLSTPGGLGRFEFLQRPEQIVITYQWNRAWRIVGMRERPEFVAPLYAGRSLGHWEGQTLVVDSVDFVDSTLLDNAGLPHSDQLHLVERYTLVDGGKRMQLRLRIEDPKTFSRSWETLLTLRHDPRGKIQEDECIERKDLTWARAKDGR